MKAGRETAPAAESKPDTAEPRPIEQDEAQALVKPKPKFAPPNPRALSYPPHSRLRVDEDNTLRVTDENSVRVPLVDFVVSTKPTEELVDMEQLENLERLGKAWLWRQRSLKADPFELD